MKKITTEYFKTEAEAMAYKNEMTNKNYHCTVTYFESNPNIIYKWSISVYESYKIRG